MPTRQCQSFARRMPPMASTLSPREAIFQMSEGEEPIEYTTLQHTLRAGEAASFCPSAPLWAPQGKPLAQLRSGTS